MIKLQFLLEFYLCVHSFVLYYHPINCAAISWMLILFLMAEIQCPTKLSFSVLVLHVEYIDYNALERRHNISEQAQYHPF
jgi:hypothetical protein